MSEDVRNEPPPVVAAILAAGSGSRFSSDTHKLHAELPPSADRPAEPVVTRTVAVAAAADIGPVIVVSGAADLRGLLPLTPGVREVHNPRWQDGQATSLQVAIDHARRAGAEVVIIGLGDQPGVTAPDWRAVATEARRPGPPITIATYDGRRGNPVALHADVWDRLPTDGDEGARRLIRFHPLLTRAVPCTGSPDDIDTVEDLRRWQSN